MLSSSSNGVAKLSDCEPFGMCAKQIPSHLCCRNDAVGVEPDPIMFNNQSTLNERPQFGPVDTISSRWRKAALGERPNERMIRQRVDYCCDTHPSRDDFETFGLGQRVALALAQGRDIKTEAACVIDLGPQGCEQFGKLSRGGNPTPERGGSPFTGEEFEFVCLHPTALGYDPFDRSIGLGLACRKNRRNVEDLTAADRLRTP